MKPRRVLDRWTIQMVDAQADWDVWEYWERERFASMEQHLTGGDILFDVGAEHGSMSAIYTKFVGGSENMVLFEPSPLFWPNLRMTFEANNLNPPLGCVAALVGDVSRLATHPDFDASMRDGWPECAWSDVETPAMAYRYLMNDAATTPTVTLDDYVRDTGIVPDAITMDVEGAEHLVLRGAREVLTNEGPKVWMSIHPDLMMRDFNVDQSAVFAEMEDMGYTAEHIHTDHEEHWFFSP